MKINITSRARKRVRAVAEGETINGTYGLSPIGALDAFRLDLLTILDEDEEVARSLK